MIRIAAFFGLIAGLVIMIIGLLTVSLWMDSADMETGELVGYLTMIVAFTSIFIAIKQYRDDHLNGAISFGGGFKIGILITLVATLIYTITWMVYAAHNPELADFARTYADQMTQQIRATAETAAAAEAEIKQMREMMDLYQNNTFFRFIITMMEIFPVGLIVTLIAAYVMKRKPVEVAV